MIPGQEIRLSVCPHDCPSACSLVVTLDRGRDPRTLSCCGAGRRARRLVMGQIDAAAPNASMRSDKDFTAMQTRISSLETLVKKIGEENEATRSATAAYEKRLAGIQAQMEKEQRRFVENSGYSVTISFPPQKRDLAGQIQARLAASGFRASLSPIDERHITARIAASQNTMWFSEEIEGKAPEVLALLIRPLLKEITTVKFTRQQTQTTFGIEEWRPFLVFPPEQMSLSLADK